MNEPVSKAHRSGFVAIVGRPSAGKSTLLNAACGHKVSIISAVPQTTRNRIRGIVNAEGGQLVFVDTPGFHESDRKFNQHMKGLIEETIREAELVLYVIDCSRETGAEEIAIARAVAKHRELPVVVALNKVDVAKPDLVDRTESWVRERFTDAPVFRVSARTGSGLDQIIQTLIGLAPEGEPVYPPDHYTDQLPEFRISELIREKAINRTSQEIPHSLYVEIADMEIREAKSGGDDTLWIRAFLLVERESQKGILVGKGGEKIKKIRQTAQKEIAALFPYRIHLDLRVKVDAKWRRKEQVLGRLVN